MGFFPDAQVQALDSGYTVANVVVVNESTITATITLKATASTGGHSVWVSLNGTAAGLASGTMAQCTNCLTAT